MENFGQENFGNSLPICQISQNFLPPIFSAIQYYNTVDRKGYDEVKNNRPPTLAKYSCSTRYTMVQKLSNKQGAKVICRFDGLRTSHS